jgi:hypothetical protein
VKQSSSGLNLTALRDALDAESLNWLEGHYPRLLDAVEAELNGGKSPEQLKRIVLDVVGFDRDALAKRVESAARAILHQQRQER